jgi:hypothetical protein
VLEVTNSRVSSDQVGNLASEVLTELYTVVCGHRPTAVRAYHEDDALLLMLRFEPDAIGDGPAEIPDALLDTAFAAMPGMIASAIEARTGRWLLPGSLSVCVDRGLAVFAFSAMDQDIDERSGEDLFRIDSAGAPPSSRPALRLAS